MKQIRAESINHIFLLEECTNLYGYLDSHHIFNRDLCLKQQDTMLIGHYVASTHGLIFQKILILIYHFGQILPKMKTHKLIMLTHTTINLVLKKVKQM